MSKELVSSNDEKTPVQKERESLSEYRKNEFNKLKELLKSDYIHFYRSYKDKLKPVYNPLSSNLQSVRKDFTDFFSAMRQLRIAVGKQKYDNFMEFIKNSELFSSIKNKIDNIGGIQSGHSYIVITRDFNILNNITTLLLFELTGYDERELMPLIRINNFDFIELANKLDSFNKKFHNEDDPMEDHEYIMGDIYYDIIQLNIGTTFANETEEKRILSSINNRMLTLMNSYKNKGMIITTGNPLPFFEDRIKEGVNKLHILDLRNIESKPIEQVEME